MLSVTAVTRPDGDIASIVQMKIVNWLQEMMQMLLLALDLEGRGATAATALWVRGGQRILQVALEHVRRMVGSLKEHGSAWQMGIAPVNEITQLHQ